MQVLHCLLLYQVLQCRCPFHSASRLLLTFLPTQKSFFIGSVICQYALENVVKIPLAEFYSGRNLRTSIWAICTAWFCCVCSSNCASQVQRGTWRITSMGDQVGPLGDQSGPEGPPPGGPSRPGGLRNLLLEGQGASETSSWEARGASRPLFWQTRRPPPG